ncbi:hypothetical protein VNO80_13295 [Phaseolus coccineus]|uniref:Uncharacterized protein n=1 Tax=Phaseolus coccineus TaxID=3886 RepID=A0AAN9N5X3_PHACN
MMQVGSTCDLNRFGIVFRPNTHHTDCVTFTANKLYSTNRRNGLLGGPLCVNLSGRRNQVGPTSYFVETNAYDRTSYACGRRKILTSFVFQDCLCLSSDHWHKLISVLRAPKSKEGYVATDDGCPLHKITDDQALAIKKALEVKGLSSNVYMGMRYWYPFTKKAIQQIQRDKITRHVVLPLYPQFSISTTGSSVRILEQAFREDAYLSTFPVSIIKTLGINEKVTLSQWLT